MNRDYWQLRTASRNYYDAYRLTTRISNRLRALARQGEAYDPNLHEQLEIAKLMKESSGNILTKIYRDIAPPKVRAFQQATTGLGEVWMARLIGEVGDFITYTEAWWETPEAGSQDEEDSLDESTYSLDIPDNHEESDDSPPAKRVLVLGEVKTTGVRELWTYCGHGDASLRRRKGQPQAEALKLGNPAAKMIVHQMAEFCLRSNGVPDKNGKPRSKTPYYDCYLKARETAEANHPDWKPGHVYNYAIRKVGKAILKDLWRVQHGEEPAYGARTPWTPDPDRKARKLAQVA